MREIRVYAADLTGQIKAGEGSFRHDNLTNTKCPVCGFENRRKKEGAGVSKRDVARYMERQRKEAAEPVNNAFAQALAGIRVDEN